MFTKALPQHSAKYAALSSRTHGSLALAITKDVKGNGEVGMGKNLVAGN